MWHGTVLTVVTKTVPVHKKTLLSVKSKMISSHPEKTKKISSHPEKNQVDASYPKKNLESHSVPKKFSTTRFKSFSEAGRT